MSNLLGKNLYYNLSDILKKKEIHSEVSKKNEKETEIKTENTNLIKKSKISNLKKTDLIVSGKYQSKQEVNHNSFRKHKRGEISESIQECPQK